MSTVLRPVTNPLVISAVMRPRTNPLRVEPESEPLTPGEKVACVLGGAARTARGQRVVHGTVVGTAVRQMGRALDVELESVSTWIHDTVPVDLDTLEPSFHPVLRIAVVDSLEATVSLLRGDAVNGRSRVPAAEIPFRTCWRCGHVPGARDVFCTGCSRRLRIGVMGGRPDAPTATSCPACWGEPGTGRMCAQCGTPRQLSPRLVMQMGRNVSLAIVNGHQRQGRAKARLVELRRQRLSREGKASWVAVVDSIVGEGPLLVTDVTTRISLQLVLDTTARPVQDVLADALERGDEIRASDIVVPCPRCNGQAQHGGGVWTPWCSGCGVRVRLTRHPAWRERIRRRKTVMHACGHVAWGAFCGSCGEPTLPESDDRFSQIESRPQVATPVAVAPAPLEAAKAQTTSGKQPLVVEEEEFDPRFVDLIRSS